MKPMKKELTAGIINTYGVLTHIQNYRKFKIRDKNYARPLILDIKQYSQMFEHEFKRLNPDTDYKQFWDSL